MKSRNPKQFLASYFHPVAVSLSVSLLVFAGTGTILKAEDEAPEAGPDPKEKAELQQMEERFGAAVEKRDSATLTELLADYYSDAIEGSKKALNKRGTIERLNAERLSFYRIEKDLKMTHSADIFKVTGLAKATPPDRNSEKSLGKKWIHVRRYWTKKEGRWLLVGQIVGPWAKAENEAKKE
jgi:hypothetical protein